MFLIAFLFFTQGVIADTSIDPLCQIRFEFKAGLICVPVSINGQGPFIASIDTGTDTIVIGDPLAEKLGLKSVPNGDAVGVGHGEVRQFKASGLDLEMGNQTVKGVEANILRLPAGVPCQAILGYGFLNDKILQIDYPNHEIRIFKDFPFAKTDQATLWKNVEVLPFDLVDKVPKIKDLAINGKKVEAALDTGGAYSLLFFSSNAVHKVGLDKAFEKGTAGLGRGYSGSEALKMAQAESLGLGRFPQVPVKAVLIENPKLQKIFGPGVCALGGGFMKNYIVTFDYKDRLVAFEKRP